MSASSKKKLRKEQNAALLTEKQQKAQKEAKKLKITSTLFVLIMVVVLGAAIVLLAVNGIRSSGIIEKSTTALTVGEHKISTVELNYYFGDQVSLFYNQWYSQLGDSVALYLSMMGLDVYSPLDEQVYDPVSGMTWADFFMDSAIEQAKANYALYDHAMANGYALTAEHQATIENNVASIQLTAAYSGVDLETYLKAVYGPGSSEESLREYFTVSVLASSYYNEHQASLTYDDAALRAYEADKYQNFTSYSYDSYYLNYNSYMPEDAGEDPTDAQIDAAVAAAKADADILVKATNADELDAAILALPVNAESTAAASDKSVNKLYTSIDVHLQDWLADASRQEGDITIIPYEAALTNDSGVEEERVLGYYVVLFHGSNDNTTPMSNVRHLLVRFEGGTTSESGTTTYSDDEKAAAKAEAEGYMNEWLNGEKTEDSFVALVKEHSADSSYETGGLFEDIHPDSSYVESFLNWSIDPSREIGDVEVIESPYGYHVMYFDSYSEKSYRDQLITEELISNDMNSWYASIVDSAPFTENNLKHVSTDLAMAG